MSVLYNSLKRPNVSNIKENMKQKDVLLHFIKTIRVIIVTTSCNYVPVEG